MIFGGLKRGVNRASSHRTPVDWPWARLAEEVLSGVSGECLASVTEGKQTFAELLTLLALLACEC